MGIAGIFLCEAFAKSVKLLKRCVSFLSTTSLA